MLAGAEAPSLIQVARRLPARLWIARPGRYWADYLLSYFAACSTFYLAGAPSIPTPLRAAAFVACVFSLYRSAAFLHEVVHQPRLRAFRLVWNLLTGVPLLCPSFLYSNHVEHHSAHLYGTELDGEYVPWGREPHAGLFLYLAGSIFVPFLAILRFALLTPLSWAIPPLRRLLEQRGSSLVIRATHRRARPRGAELRRWLVQEAAASVWILSILTATAAGLLSARWLGTAIAVYGVIHLVNAFRTALSHRFELDQGRVSHDEQVADSVNHAEGRWTELICPLGLRYHALHHMLPAMPYHSLAEAHAILLRALPEDSPYHVSNSPSLWSTWRRLVSASAR